MDFVLQVRILDAVISAPLDPVRVVKSAHCFCHLISRARPPEIHLGVCLPPCQKLDLHTFAGISDREPVPVCDLVPLQLLDKR